MAAASPRIIHKLGLAGNFMVDQFLHDAAKTHGLQIYHTGGNHYELRHQNPDFNVKNICPAGAGYKHGPLTLSQLKTTLEFLHQPLRVSAGRVTHTENLSRADRKQLLQQNREMLHQFLRFATTGSVQLTTDQKIIHTGPECHAEAGEKMQDFDAWRKQMELGNPDRVKTAVPGTGFDAERGFYLLVDDTLRQNAQGNTAELRDTFWSLLSDTKKQPVSMTEKTVYLTAAELETLAGKIIHHPHMKSLLRNVEQDEMQQAAKHRIDLDEQQRQTIAHELDAVAGHNTLKNELENILKSTTALSPLINSAAVKNAWNKFHWTKEGNCPFVKISREMHVLEERLRMELERPDFTQERLSAVQTEFASLTSFVRLAAKEMGFENMEAAMRQDPGSVYVAEKFLSPHHQRGLALIRQGMEQEAASPLKELTNGLWASLKTVVSDVYNFTTTNDSRLRAIALMTAMYMAAIPLYNNPAFMEKMPAFMGGGKPTAAVQQPTQQPSLSPELQQAIEEHLKNNQQAPLPTALRHEVEQHMQKQTVSEEIVSASFEGFSLDGEDLKTTVAVPKSDLQSKILPANDSTPMFCHPHMGKTTVLHCYFNDKIKNFMTGTVDTVDQIADRIFMAANIIREPQSAFSQFSQGAREVIGPTANFWMYFNLIQLMAHIPFFAMMGARGARHGIHAYGGTKNLFGEFADPFWTLLKYRPLVVPGALGTAAATAANDAGITAIILSTIAAGAIGNKLWQRSPGTKDDLKLQANDIETLQTVLEEQLAQQPGGTAFNTRIAGVKHQFTLSAHNLQSTQKELSRFAHAINHTSNQIGIDNKYYQEFLNGGIAAVAQALTQFSHDNDAKALQTTLNGSLADIMGAQTRHTDAAPIYKTLFNQSADTHTLNLLTRHGNAKHAAMKRQERMARYFERFARPEQTGMFARLEDRTKSGIVLSSNALWHSIVRASRETQAAYESIPNKKLVIGSAAAATAAIIGIDLSGQAQELFNPDTAHLVDMAARSLGWGYGINGTTGTFGTYNIYDDTILTDTMGGLTALTAGVGAYYGLKPLAAYSREKSRELNSLIL
jgi:hypothetical protein